MNKPKPKDYGFQESNGFDTESGWMYEGAEEAYFDALGKWEAEQKKLKHAPGPWFAKNRDASTNKGWEVRDVNNEAITGWGSVQTTMQNAQLIAAAPEMLAELEKMYNFFNKPAEQQENLFDVLHNIRRVISKAKGQ